MDEMELEGELGKGNYGTVQKVLHKPTKVVMAMKVGIFLLVNSAPFGIGSRGRIW